MFYLEKCLMNNHCFVIWDRTVKRQLRLRVNSALKEMSTGYCETTGKARNLTLESRTGFLEEAIPELGTGGWVKHLQHSTVCTTLQLHAQLYTWERSFLSFQGMLFMELDFVNPFLIQGTAHAVPSPNKNHPASTQHSWEILNMR